jgi:glucose-6-phosphate isomerase
MTCLTLDFTNCLASSIGATHGLTNAEMDTLIAKIPKHHENVAELRSTGESSWFDLPNQDTTALKKQIKEHLGKWENLVIVGIGGACISARSLLDTLAPLHLNLLPPAQRKKAPRIFYIDNADPATVNQTLAVIDPKKTLFQFISRSGTTAETNALLLWLLPWLRKKAGKNAPDKQVVILTDPDRSPAAEVAAKEGVTVLPIAENIGTRFGVFSNSALFPAALCGLDIDALLAGAQEMERRCWHGDAWANPAYMHSLIHYLLTRKRRKTIHATVAFDGRMKGIIEWYDHLLAVSLGKMLNRKGKAVHVGPTPSSCIGPNGLHGFMQLYAEGPFDKVTTFITVKDHGSDLAIPKAHPKVEPFAYLGGHSLSEMVEASYLTAAQDITSSGRPNMTIILDSISPQAIGCLFYMLQLSTVMSAELYGIDPFNQPGIDLGKQGIYATLGRSGFEDKAKVLSEYKARPVKTC